MLLLVAGLLAFFVIHALPVWAPALRMGLATKLGRWPWMGLFSILSIASLWVATLGWSSTIPTFLYDLGPGVQHLNLLLMPIALALFVAPYARSHLRLYVRNQQYTAVKIWAVGHLLANGDSRSLILFGSFLIWAVLMVIGVKKRDGAYVKPTDSWRAGDIATAAIALGATYFVASMHPSWFGVIALPF